MILSIESSCDDSSLALTQIEDCKLLFHQKISQDEIHSTYGGIVPEIASRLHAQRLPKILENLKRFLNNDFSDLKAIAVTTEPGLSVTLIEGLMMAKTLALSLSLPLLSINHLKGHIYSLFINQKESVFPLSVLLVSGGHTLILEASLQEIKIIAQSLDDSFGESFDKASKMLGFGYPGGPIIQELATHCTQELYSLPIPLQNKTLAFSFSGLKNAMRLEIQKQAETLNKNALAYAFQKSACTHIVQKCKSYFLNKREKNEPISHFAIVGGASANLFLREKIKKLTQSFNINLLLAPLEFCSDNSAMIGRAAVQQYLEGNFADIINLDISPRSREF
ncbi:tRNA (adenosine(37)-N6)-threonylcarbamoyltransferase complex transferase subunit TsaD [Helicobacter cholecystus]|uniref:tRNA (adenosine(37)-N6)-threonylcarbamoyltransferase complex transferase subunit TsaD n=1 Tax=Helicobacter cholecystus TaxID=45498 RepID=UPI00273A361D|nr:tRNA (adenosine(37)-N6)-threonylcarbamoyltransferase complex transferase subunit TsaD [Helicobacter cholecystus]